MYKTAPSDTKNSAPIAAETFKGLAERERLKAAFDALVICETAEELAEYLDKAWARWNEQK